MLRIVADYVLLNIYQTFCYNYTEASITQNQKNNYQNPIQFFAFQLFLSFISMLFQWY